MRRFERFDDAVVWFSKEVIRVMREARERGLASVTFSVRVKYEPVISLLFDHRGAQGSIKLRVGDKTLVVRVKAGQLMFFLGDFFERKPSLEEYISLISDLVTWARFVLKPFFKLVPNEYGRREWELVFAFYSENFFNPPEWTRGLTRYTLRIPLVD